MSYGVNGYRDTYIDYYRYMPNYQPKRMASSYATNPDRYSVQYVSDKGNTCTDGKDDGKINTFAKLGHVTKGIFRMGTNMVSSMIKHPFRTAAMIGLASVPVVGPIAVGAIAAYGVYSGGKTIIDGISTAQNATSDAEAKDAWENIGTGAATVTLSAVALKGSTGALRNQLSGSSKTVNLIKELKTKGTNKTDIASQALKEAKLETLENIKTTQSTIKNKAKNMAEITKGVYNNIKTNGFGAVKQYVSQGKNFATQNLAKIKFKKPTKGTLESMKSDFEAQGATVTKRINGLKVQKGDTVELYDNNGAFVSKTTTTKSGGQTIIRKEVPGKNGISQTSTVVKNAEGKTISKIQVKNNQAAALSTRTKTGSATEYIDNSTGARYDASKLTELEKASLNYKMSNHGIGENVTFGKYTIPLTRSQAYQLAPWILNGQIEE